MFGTSGIRGPVGTSVTADLALALGRAVATDGADRVVVGRDARETGNVLTDALTAGLRECGADVIDLGRASTPTIARAVGWREADAGVAVTASHNPPADNGFKLWTPSGQAFDERRQDRIERLLDDDSFAVASWDEFGERTTWNDAVDRHVDALVASVDPIDDLSVVVDAGTGVGGLTVDALEALGCDVQTLNVQPDGHFPARPSEPTAEHCRTLSEFVAATDADLGIAHDGDADRMRAVTADGTFVGQDPLLALFARDAARPGAAVAAPVNTSLVVDDTLAGLGATVSRTRVGDVFVAERATEPDVVFGGEPSGAWIWPDETLCPDGPLAACKLAAMVAEAGSLADLLAPLDPYPIRRGRVETDAKEEIMNRVRERAIDEFDVDLTDGVRVESDGGWFLIRPSGTQPLVRITAEARDEDRSQELFERAETLVRDAAERDE